MFYLKYLRRELGERKRQTVLTAVGLALGVGLVITVTAVSSGVNTAQAEVVHALYGVGTDLSVTKNPAPPSPGQLPPGVCLIGQSCSASLGYPPLGTLTDKTVAQVAKLPDVSEAAGAFTLNYAKDISSSNPQTTNVDGVDVGHLGLGPLSSGKITSGKELSASEADSDVAVVDSNYAIASGLHVGSTVTIAGRGFKVIGIVKQAEAASPPQVYIPLDPVQALYASVNHTAGDLLNTIYVSTTSAANVASVQSELHKAVPSATVSSQADLASEVTGSLKNTASLAHDLGTWLAVLVLIAAFALATLLTLAAVAGHGRPGRPARNRPRLRSGRGDHGCRAELVRDIARAHAWRSRQRRRPGRRWQSTRLDSPGTSHRPGPGERHHHRGRDRDRRRLAGRHFRQLADCRAAAGRRAVPGRVTRFPPRPSRTTDRRTCRCTS
jgi:putative ABC transport system permease protein